MELSVPFQRSNICMFYNKICLIWLEIYLSQLVRFWYLLHMQAAKALASLHSTAQTCQRERSGSVVEC